MKIVNLLVALVALATGLVYLYRGGGWIALLIVAVVVLGAVWWWASTKLKEDSKEHVTPLPSAAPERYDYTPAHSFVFSDAAAPPDDIRFARFKELCESGAFVHHFHAAILESLTIKLERLETVKQACRDTTASLAVTRLMVSVQERLDTATFDSAADALKDSVRALDTLVGRDAVKDFVSQKLYAFAYNPKVFLNTFQNIALYGPSGIGKTEIAKVIAYVYAKSGILARHHVQLTTKRDFTTAYVDESAQKTYRLLTKNLESVVFIDEAYDMTPPPSILGNKVDHGQEAIAEMVNFIDKHVGMSVIVAAGYEDEMKTRFMDVNQGLARRFPKCIRLDTYGTEELTDLAVMFVNRSNPDLVWTKEHANYLHDLIAAMHEKDPALLDKQAGDMLTLAGLISESVPGRNWPSEYRTVVLSGVNKFLAPHHASIGAA